MWVSVSLLVCPYGFNYLSHRVCLGFIPVAYTWLMSSLRPPIQLPSDSEDDASGPIKPSGKRLSGRRILLLILPACCDLAGTTVSHIPSAHPT